MAMTKTDFIKDSIVLASGGPITEETDLMLLAGTTVSYSSPESTCIYCGVCNGMVRWC